MTTHEADSTTVFRSDKRLAVVFTTLALIAVAMLSLASSAPAAKAPKGFFAIAPQEGVTRNDTAKMKAGGIHSMRVAVSWTSIQPKSAKKFDWNALDSTVKAAARNKVRVLPVLYDSPPWLTNRPTNLPVATRNQLDRWRNFVAEAVDRYGPDGAFWKQPNYKNGKLPKMSIREWQIWNEVNFYYFATPVSPAKYAKLLNASAATIRHHDPGADVMVSGLYGTPKGPARKAMDADDYIRKLSKYVKRSSVDSVALHAYAPDTSGIKSIVTKVRRAMVQSGFRTRPMLITEMGWGSGSGNAFLKGSQSGQARQMKSAFNYLVSARHKLKLRRVYWYAWKDTDPRGENCSFCYTVGLFKHGKGLKPKKAWNTFKSFSYRP